jgi:hypothetical protein
MGLANAEANASLCNHVERMREMNFEHWWTRAPQVARLALVLAAIGAMVLGGSADHFWG